jgi:uncharacterized protein (DUF1778 family)
MDDPVKFRKLVQIRVPESFSEAIDLAAKMSCQSRSDFIGQSVLDRLQKKGFDLQQPRAAQ